MAITGLETDEQEALRRPSFLTSGLWWEKAHPILAAALAAVAGRMWGLSPPRPETLAAVVGFAAAVSGFAATLLGILFSVRGSWKLRELEAAGKFGILKGYVYAAVRSGLLSVALGLWLMAIRAPVLGLGLAAPLWLGMAVHTGLCCHRAARIMYRLL